MPRLTRLDFHGAIHFVRIDGHRQRQIFFDVANLRRVIAAPADHAPDLLAFQALTAAAAAGCNMLVHGYCIQPNSCLLVLERRGVPLESFMRRLCGQYSKYLQHQTPAMPANVFERRYSAKVIAPEYLPHAVRQVHRSPVLNGLAPQRRDYPFSSERAYLGISRSTWLLRTRRLRAALELRSHVGLAGYREFMDQDDSPYVAALFARGSPQDSRIVGSKVFAQQARQRATYPVAPPTREELIAKVAHLLEISPLDILSATRQGSLGRYLVAWYGLRSGAATLTEMGKWFSVTGATLGQGIRLHRKLNRHLFEVSP